MDNDLGAPFAVLKDCRLGMRGWMEKFGDWHHADVIEDWVNGAEAQWSFTALKAGRYHLCADYECWAEADGSELEGHVAGLHWTFPAIYTGGGQGQRTRFRHVRLALVDIPAGPGQMTLRGLDIKGAHALALHRVTFEAVD